MEYGLVVVWGLAHVALAALGLPIAARLFPRSATRGAGFALPVSLGVLGLVGFWVGHVAFPLPALVAGLAALVACAALAGLDTDALRDGAVVPDVRVERGALLETAAVFVLAFAFLVAVRAVDPAVHAIGGEKFLDFGLVKSLLRTTALPPEDIWFANEPVRYYYGGHLLTALLATLTGTPGRFAYNLALASFYATFVAAAFDLAGNVAAARGTGRRTAGAFGAFFVALAANLRTAVAGVLESLPAGLRAWLGATLKFDPARFLGEFSYWTASRVIPGTINEFPLFAWLNGDLHAHMTGTPFLLLAAALSFALFRTPAAERRRRRLLLFGALPLVGGLQAVVNTWSLPTVFGLAWLGLALAPAAPRTLLPAALRDPLDRAAAGRPAGAELLRPALAGVLVAVAAGLAALVAAPFLGRILGPGGSARTLELLPVAMRSGLDGLLLVHGAFLALFGAHLFARVGADRPAEVLLAAAVLAWAALAISLPVLALVGPLLVAGWVAVRAERAGFEAALVVGGAGLVTIVELVYLNEQAGPGRMNTVFKTYAQVWALWAVATGPAVASLLDPPSRPDLWPSQEARGAAGAVFVAALVVATSTYAALALPGHFSGGYPEEPTLDATDFLEEYHPSEARAIAFVDSLSGQPTLLSAPATGVYPGAEDRFGHPPGMYSFHSSPAASLTGVPTVAGWHHEVGYRGPEAYFERVRDVDAAYTSREAAVRVLATYDVEYVWVGPAERARYGEVTAFGSIPGVRPVLETPTVTIYRVDQEELPA